MSRENPPRYEIVFDEGNPFLEDLVSAQKRGGTVMFAMRIAGATLPCKVPVSPTVVTYTPSAKVSFCLITGYTYELDRPTIRIEGMYHLTSRGYGGFDPK